MAIIFIFTDNPVLTLSGSVLNQPAHPLSYLGKETLLITSCSTIDLYLIAYFCMNAFFLQSIPIHCHAELLCLCCLSLCGSAAAASNIFHHTYILFFIIPVYLEFIVIRTSTVLVHMTINSSSLEICIHRYRSHLL